MKAIAIYVACSGYAEQYFGEVLEAYRNKCECLIFHNDSLTSGKSSEPEDGYYDVGRMSAKALMKLSREKHVGCVLVTNFRSLVDVYMFKVCNEMNIPIVYMEHGLLMSKIGGFKAVNMQGAMRRYATYLMKIAWAVITGLFGVKVVLECWRALFRDDYSAFRIGGALLYADHSYETLGRYLDLGGVSVRYSGYPVYKNDEEKREYLSMVPKKQVLFVHQPLIQDGYSSLSLDDEIRLIEKIGEIARGKGYMLVLKLHPRDDYSDYRSLEDRGIVVASKDTNVHQLIAESESVLGHFSTALFAAVLLDREIYIIDYWGLDRSIGNLFKDYYGSIGSEDELRTSLAGGGSRVVNDGFAKRVVGSCNTHSNRLEKLEEIVGW